jgi:hypothetical protein
VTTDQRVVAKQDIQDAESAKRAGAPYAHHRNQAKDTNGPYCIDKAGYIYFSRCTSDELFFPCWGSVAALALANCNEHKAEANTTRSHPPAPSVLSTVPKAREI